MNLLKSNYPTQFDFLLENTMKAAHKKYNISNFSGYRNILLNLTKFKTKIYNNFKKEIIMKCPECKSVEIEFSECLVCEGYGFFIDDEEGEECDYCNGTGNGTGYGQGCFSHCKCCGIDF